MLTPVFPVSNLIFPIVFRGGSPTEIVRSIIRRITIPMSSMIFSYRPWSWTVERLTDEIVDKLVLPFAPPVLQDRPQVTVGRSFGADLLIPSPDIVVLPLESTESIMGGFPCPRRRHRTVRSKSIPRILVQGFVNRHRKYSGGRGATAISRSASNSILRFPSRKSRRSRMWEWTAIPAEGLRRRYDG